MKKLLITICAVCLLLTGCGGNFSGQRKIVVGMDESPLGFINEKGELVGFEVELARATAKRMGVAIEFKMIDWNNKEIELNSGNIDMIWNGMDITAKRKEVMLFSKPYMDNRQIVLVKKGNINGIRYLSDLAGKVIGTKAGSTAEMYINAHEEIKKEFADFKTYDINESTFKALENGEIDAIIVDEIIGRFEMRKHSDKFELIEITVGPATELGIGFRKDDTELRDRVQKAFNEIVKDGTAKKISVKWFDADLIKSRK